MSGPGDIIDLDAVFAQRLAEAGDPFDLGVALAQARGAEPSAALQPGLGIPASVVEEAARAAPAASSPPPADEAPAFIGFPRVPDEEPPDMGAVLAQPDAISGADAIPASAGHPGLGIPAHLVEDAVRTGIQQNLDAGVDPMTGEPPAQEEIDFEPDQLTEADRQQSLADMSDAELSMYATEQDEARRQQGAADLLKAAKADREQAEAELKISDEARGRARQERAQLEAEAKALADTPPPDWFEDGGIGRTITAALMAFAGGLVQHLNGGRNLGLEMVDKAIDRYNARQSESYRRKKGAIDDRRAAVAGELSDVDADERRGAAVRAAAWESTIRLIDAEQQNFDPQGTTAMRMEMAKREALARQAQALAAFEEREIKRMEAQGKSQLEIAKFLEQSQKNRIDAENDRRRIGIEGYRAATDRQKAQAEIDERKEDSTPLAVEELRRLFPNAPEEAFQLGPTSLKKFRKHLSSFGEGAATGRGASEGKIKQAQARLEESGPGGSPYGIGDQEGNPIRAKNGNVFEVKDPTERKRARELITAAKNVRRIADIVKVMRADSGGASSTVGSDEYQELKSLASQIDFETFVGYGLGAPSEGDKALAEGVRGGKDIASFIHDPSSGFTAYAKGLEEKANEELRTLGYDGAPVKFKSIEPAQALERTAGQNVDVWNSPLLAAPDEAARARAVAAAAGSADALARQVNAGVLKVMARENHERLAAGVFSKEQHQKAQKALRREWKKRVARMTPEQRQTFGVPLLEQRAQVTDEYLDAQLLAPMGGK